MKRYLIASSLYEDTQYYESDEFPTQDIEDEQKLLLGHPDVCLEVFDTVDNKLVYPTSEDREHEYSDLMAFLNNEVTYLETN